MRVRNWWKTFDLGHPRTSSLPLNTTEENVWPKGVTEERTSLDPDKYYINNDALDLMILFLPA